MTDPQDPPRLTDAEGANHLGELVRECRSDVATPDEMKRLEARLVPLIWPPAPPPVTPDPGSGATSGPAGGAATSAGTGAALKAGAVAIAIGLAGGGLWLAKPKSTPAEHTAVATSTQNDAPRADSTGDTAPSTTPSNAEGDKGEPKLDTVAPESPGHGTTKERNPQSLDSPSESDLLGRAHAALRSDPARALALADEHRRKFPNGVLVQEREVLSIEALERLGRHADAVSRADRFLRNFPGSAHRSKVNAVIGR